MSNQALLPFAASITTTSKSEKRWKKSAAVLGKMGIG
jgi:hypothetical protein